jgi:hypothetical protein
MNEAAVAKLLAIGGGLDRQVFPVVKNGGIVEPSDCTVPTYVGKEILNDKWNGKGAGSAPARQERQARGSWPPRETASFVGQQPSSAHEAELESLCRAYPNTTVWRQDGGLWLLTESGLLQGLQRAASFLIGVSTTHRAVRAWGFWTSTIAHPMWIGPRHTNFPDGSVCAFEPADGTWVFGDPLVDLLDLYSVWALRHLYLEQFGRWPGAQSVAHPYERIMELHQDELCGCGNVGIAYRNCCMVGDHARDKVADAVNFLLRYWGGRRCPPEAVVRSMRGEAIPPLVDELTLAG